jgi:sugar phosphate isomerase/epimerase
MNRTTVCLSLAALTLTGLSLHAADQPDTRGAHKLGWKLTLQSWTVHHTVFDSIDVAHKLGVHFIEIYPDQQISSDDQGKFGPAMTDAQIQAVLDKAKSADVKIIDYGVTNIPGKEDEARKLFDWAKKVGLTLLVAEPDPKDLPAIDKIAGEYGIRVAIHDHPKPSRYWDPEFTYGHIKDLKNVGFCADVGHWKRSGLDPVDVLKKYGDKVFSLHFKDLVPNEDGKEGLHDVVWGTGQSRAADMLAALKEKGFQGPIAIEFEYKWDIPTLQKCVDFFYEQADNLAAK